MAVFRVAQRYAQALLELAAEQQALEAVYNDMEAIEHLLKQYPKVEAILNNPIIPALKKLSILKRLFMDRVHPLTLHFMEMLTRRNRANVLLEVAISFEQLYEQKKGIQRASLQSAIPLDSNLKASITSLIQQISQKNQIKLLEEVNPDLIGGFVLRIGDKQIDASVRARLKQIRHTLLSSPQ